MSELKARHIVDVYYSYNKNPFGERSQVYLKSEADKVIDELKDKCQMHNFFWDGCGFAKRGFKNTIAVSEAYDFLEEENAQLKESIAIYQRNEKLDIRELRHQKYKRCLAMAMWCKSKSEIYNEFAADASEYMPSYEARFHSKAVLYQTWAMRWLELAEKFKDKEE